MGWDFINQATIKKTRKDHKCICCGRTIPKSTANIEHWSGKFEGDFQSSYECHWCREHRDYFIDDGYYGEFWNGAQSVFYDLIKKFDECDCTDRHGLAGNIEHGFDKDDSNYLVFKCENCGKVWHKEYMPVVKGES